MQSSVAAAAPTLESADSQKHRQELADQILTRARQMRVAQMQAGK